MVTSECSLCSFGGGILIQRGRSSLTDLYNTATVVYSERFAAPCGCNYDGEDGEGSLLAVFIHAQAKKINKLSSFLTE